MEYLVFLASILCGLLIGFVFGFSATGHSRVSSGNIFQHNNFIMRLLVTPPKSRTISQNFIYFILMVSWFFIFFGAVMLPVMLLDSLGTSPAWVEYLLLLIFVISILVGKLLGRYYWLRWE